MNNRPIVAFLIPIASSRIIADWNLGSKYLQQTLNSIFNSSHENFRVVVAGNENPDFELPRDSRFKFLSLNHPLSFRSQITYNDKVNDKMAKIAAAWNYAKATWDPEYVMKVDWDDFISSKLVAWLASAGGAEGYCIKDGWLWETGSRYFIKQMEKFDGLCGTCLIFRSDIADRTGPFRVSSDDIRKQVHDHHSMVPGATTSTLLLNNQHHRADAYYEYLGCKLMPVPFRAAIYRTANPISLSRAGRGGRIFKPRWLLGHFRRLRLITPQLRKEFLLE